MGGRGLDQLKVLMVEDDREFGGELLEGLAAYGMHAVWRETLDDLAEHLGAEAPDILLLDQFVNRQDAVQMLTGLRAEFNGGIVLLTGNPSQVDRIVALEAGADDFVAKSLGLRELVARLRAVWRRVQPPRPAENAAASGWKIDERRLEVLAPGGEPVRLTSTEYQLLLLLLRNTNTIVSRETISLNVLGRAFSAQDRSVDNVVSRLRRALQPYSRVDPVIRSIRGHGYLFMAFEIADALARGAD